MALREGNTIIGALVETFIDKGVSRPRVRALLEEIPSDWRVEFPRKLREDYEVGTRFRADLKVCQKHNKDGSLRGSPYLRADAKTITRIDDYTPEFSLKAVPKQGANDPRVYEYIGVDDFNEDFQSLRAKALQAESLSEASSQRSITRKRDSMVRAYVLARANGVCESCKEIAPFITKAGAPYLEVHHIKALSEGGQDTIYNTAGICPNCHAEVTHGEKADVINEKLSIYVNKVEK